MKRYVAIVWTLSMTQPAVHDDTACMKRYVAIVWTVHDTACRFLSPYLRGTGDAPRQGGVMVLAAPGENAGNERRGVR